ncbi:hypothetical protein QTP88_015576 [Uroleucon formosanum]
MNTVTEINVKPPASRCNNRNDVPREDEEDEKEENDEDKLNVNDILEWFPRSVSSDSIVESTYCVDLVRRLPSPLSIKVKGRFCPVKNDTYNSSSNKELTESTETSAEVAEHSLKTDQATVENDNLSSTNSFVKQLETESTGQSSNINDPIHSLPTNRLELKERILKGPYRPVLSLFPRTKQGQYFRSFQECWYKEFKWLEYSIVANAVFCFPCRCFSGNEGNSSQLEYAFSKIGFKNWYRAIDRFKKHQQPKAHINSAK